MSYRDIIGRSNKILTYILCIRGLHFECTRFNLKCYLIAVSLELMLIYFVGLESERLLQTSNRGQDNTNTLQDVKTSANEGNGGLIFNFHFKRITL